MRPGASEYILYIPFTLFQTLKTAFRIGSYNFFKLHYRFATGTLAASYLPGQQVDVTLNLAAKRNVNGNFRETGIFHEN